MQNLEQILTEAHKKCASIADWLRLSVSLFNQYELFFGHGTTNAHDEAAYLILKTLNLPIDQLTPYLDAKLLDHEIQALSEMLNKRITQRMPASYITREAIFHEYSFYVDQRVIIPRSFIGEIMLHGGLDEYIPHRELVNNVLDLCTGNGSLAIVASDYFYASEVTAIDIDKDALEVAKINLKRYDLEDRIKLIRSDLFSKLKPENQYDLILTNPPYVDKKHMQNLPKEYLHEPRLALFGGNDGLKLVRKIIEQSRFYLTQFGMLIVEMGNNVDELEEFYPGLNFTWLETVNDGAVFMLTKADLDLYFS